MEAKDLKVLLLAIDDMPDNLTSLKAVVSDQLPGAKVLTALNGPKGIELARSEDPDVILLDIVMPGMDGFEVCRRLKADERLASIPVLFLTALRTDRNSRIQALEAGGDGFLSKPLNELELVAQIRAMSRIKAANRMQRQEKEQLARLVAERTRELEQELAERKQGEQALAESRSVLLGILEDQARDQAALQASEKRFRGLIEQSLTGVYISRDGVFLYANPRLEQILGYGPGELVDVRADDIVLAEDLPIMQEQREALRAGAVSSSYEVRARRRDGSVIELGMQGRIDELNGATVTIGMAQDVTEKKRAEDEIKRYVEELKTAFMSTVEVATSLSELRDPYTAGHERRVGKIGAAIGAELGLAEQRQEGLMVAGYLHDIGKITIPAEILSRPGKLSQIEYNLIQAHAQAGYDVLKSVQFPWPVAEVALQHHERMDGGGYPQGLKGEEILLEARIMAVADVVEAMSSHRPYRAGLGIEKALAEVERGIGTKYDEAVVNACLTLFREKGYSIPE